MGRFTEKEYQLCYDGLKEAFYQIPAPTDLSVLLNAKFGIRLGDITALFQDFPTIVNSVISHMEARDLHYDLVIEAHKWRPQNRYLTTLKDLIEWQHQPEDAKAN